MLEQVVVSPFGMGEVTDQDFEAVLCGCFLVKPGAGSIHAFPDFLQAGSHVMEADLDWSGLQDKLAALDLVRPFPSSPQKVYKHACQSRAAGALFLSTAT